MVPKHMRKHYGSGEERLCHPLPTHGIRSRRMLHYRDVSAIELFHFRSLGFDASQLDYARITLRFRLTEGRKLRRPVPDSFKLHGVESRAYIGLTQNLDDCGVDLLNDVGRSASGSPHAIPSR